MVAERVSATPGSVTVADSDTARSDGPPSTVAVSMAGATLRTVTSPTALAATPWLLVTGGVSGRVPWSVPSRGGDSLSGESRPSAGDQENVSRSPEPDDPDPSSLTVAPS